jgi:hypothetical protein
MKTEKNKKKGKKKRKKGETDRTAQSGSTSPAHLQPATPEPLLFSLSFCFSDVWDPHVIFLLPQSTRQLPPVMPPVIPRRPRSLL